MAIHATDLLPSEVWLHIANFAEKSALLNLRGCTKELNEIASEAFVRKYTPMPLSSIRFSDRPAEGLLAKYITYHTLLRTLLNLPEKANELEVNKAISLGKLESFCLSEIYNGCEPQRVDVYLQAGAKADSEEILACCLLGGDRVDVAIIRFFLSAIPNMPANALVFALFNKSSKLETFQLLIEEGGCICEYEHLCKAALIAEGKEIVAYLLSKVSQETKEQFLQRNQNALLVQRPRFVENIKIVNEMISLNVVQGAFSAQLGSSFEEVIKTLLVEEGGLVNSLLELMYPGSSWTCISNQ